MVAKLRKVSPIALPAPVTARPVVIFSGGSATANFVSQVIAERTGMAPTTEVRHEPVAVALDAYSESARKTERRMPVGYNRSLTA
jgi:hypothetical protein